MNLWKFQRYLCYVLVHSPTFHDLNTDIVFWAPDRRVKIMPLAAGSAYVGYWVDYSMYS